MADEKAEVTMSRKEYDALKAGAAPAPAGGDAYDTRGFKTIEGMEDIDTNGDGIISQSEKDMHLEDKRKELEKRSGSHSLSAIDGWREEACPSEKRFALCAAYAHDVRLRQ